MHSFEVVFDSYFVPDTHVIGGDGGLGRGFYLQMHGFAGSRLQTAGRALGVMAAAFDEGFRYINDRYVFGKPLIDYSLVRHNLVRIAARIQACRPTDLSCGEDARCGAR